MAPLSATVGRLGTLLGSRHYSVDQVEAIVRLDGPLTGRLLQYANSAASGSRTQIGTVRAAIVRVGVGWVMNLATAATVRRDLMQALPEYGLSEGELWRHSVATAIGAEVVGGAMKTEAPAEAFTAGLLHDIGKLLIARFLDPAHLRRLAEARAAGSDASRRAEADLIGMNHAELGGLVAAHWSLPARLVAGITYHHAPGEGHDPICDMVHVANALAKRAGGGAPADDDVRVQPDALARLRIPPARLPALADGVAERIEQTVASIG
jgi:HD-like signal output (HDOD) protein